MKGDSERIVAKILIFYGYGISILINLIPLKLVICKSPIWLLLYPIFIPLSIALILTLNDLRKLYQEE
jgi:hypothetical protein